MNKRIGAVLAALTLIPLAACGRDTTTDTVSYRIDQPVTALVMDARAASITIETGPDAVTVTENLRYGGERPRTAHQVDGQALRLTETGCGDDHVRCEVEYRIQVPSATKADITAAAGAVTVHGLTGNLTVNTEAGAVEGRGLAGDQVTVTTNAGAASLEFAKPPSMIKATTQVGAVEVRVPDGLTYAVNAHTTAGAADVSVRQDSASPHRIEAQSELGAVTIEPM